MAAINELISRIEDPELRASIQAEVNKLTSQKKFGLVFEDHIPECTPLYDVPIRTGSLVAPKSGSIQDLHTVTAVKGEKAICIRQSDKETVEMDICDLVSVARFGEPIYPCLQPIDTVCRAPDSDLWHTLIEADNYHALQLLEYLYAGKVDCIYIDPPYNTGAKDWKYNNAYVDSTDVYRHSKWLSMMKKRLIVAEHLLNPNDSVLIIAIDENESCHLGVLLEELFPAAKIQMVSVVINPKGRATNYFTRTDEYLYFVFFGDASVNTMLVSEGETEVRWPYLKRSDTDSTRGHRPRQFYPIYVNDLSGKIEKIGDPISSDIDRFSVEALDGCTAVFPVNEDGTEMEWGLTGGPLCELNDRGFVRVGKKRHNNPMPYSISYLSTEDVKKVDSGKLKITGEREDGTKIVVNETGKSTRMQTVWTSGSYDAGAYGKSILKKILLNRQFPFPKSLYAVYDTLKHIVGAKTDALIVDFFAGSGTTLHAVNLLNAEDGGHRRCIMVTNNEVSADEAKTLSTQGYQPGDPEWERLGIARYVTWPRTVCSIEGHDVNGNPLKGNYIGSDVPMADGFKANAAFFKLGFLDKASVRVGRQFREMLPTLWMKAGCYGPCPSITEDRIPDFLILPENRMAILTDNTVYAAFREQVEKDGRIDTVYLVTDSEADYRNMARGLSASNKYQLYRDYLDNFRINSRG